MARRPPARAALARKPLALAAATALAVSACRSGTVSVAYAPRVGDTYDYRYEIEATVTRSVEGATPVVTHLDTELVAHEVVRAVTSDGARIRLELTGEGGAPRTVVAIVDRAGSLEGVELVEGLGDALSGLADEDALVPTHLAGPPDRPLAPGDRWTLREGDLRGEGRLDRLGVVDGSDVAVVHTSASEDLSRSVRAGASDTEVTGRVRSGSVTSYDLDDGAIRRSRSWSSGSVVAELAPPNGVEAEPVRATLRFEVAVRVTREG